MKGLNMVELFFGLILSCSVLLGMAWYGSIPNPPIASDFLQHSIVNSIAPTQLSSLTIQANTVSGLQILRYDLTGFVINSTGVNQAPPTIVISLTNGGSIFSSNFAATALPTSPTPYCFRFSILFNPSNGQITVLDAYTWAEIGLVQANLGTVELRRETSFVQLVFNPAASSQLQVTVTNAIANANYSTTVEMAQLIAS